LIVLMLYHSERIFERGRIPTVSASLEVAAMFAQFNYDSSNQCAGFFAIAQNDISGVFFVILNELLGRGKIPSGGALSRSSEMFAQIICDSSIQTAGFFTIAQNDISGVFFVILKLKSLFILLSIIYFLKSKISLLTSQY